MKKIIHFFFLTFVYIAICFVEYSYSYKQNPTQPIILDFSNSVPIPNYANCSSHAFSACASSSYSSFTDELYLLEFCGDPNVYERFRLDNSDGINCEGSGFDVEIDCLTCSCPSGYYRDRHVCIPNAGLDCPVGISNFLTGECYPESCPYGDGSPEDCNQVPACVDSELTTLITFPEPARCECTGGLVWNPNEESCVEPQCNGENNSPIESIFDSSQGSCVCPSTHIYNSENNSCQRVSCENENEIFMSSTQECVVPANCQSNETLITATNTCATYYFDDCEAIDNYQHAPALLEQDKQECRACLASGNAPVIHDVYWLNPPYYDWGHSCSTNSENCTNHNGEWNSILNLCLNADPLEERSSSSSQSNSASSQSNSNSSSASSINSGGGSGSSSGSNTSTGGNGGNSSTGGGSGGTGGGSSSGSGTASSQGAGECDPESRDYLACISPDLSDLPNHTQTDSGFSSIDQVNQAFLNRVSNSPIVKSFDKFKNIISVEHAECPNLSIDLSDTILGVELSTTIICDIFDLIKPVITVVMLAVFAFLAFRIFASA